MCYRTSWTSMMHMTSRSVLSLVFDDMWLSPGLSPGEFRLCLRFKGSSAIPNAKEAVDRYFKVLTTMRWNCVHFSLTDNKTFSGMMYDTCVVVDRLDSDTLLVYAKIQCCKSIHGRRFTVNLPPIRCFWYSHEKASEIVMKNPHNTGGGDDILIHIEWKKSKINSTELRCTPSMAREIFERWCTTSGSNYWQENVFGEGCYQHMMTTAYVSYKRLSGKCSIPSFKEQRCVTDLLLMARVTIQT